MHPPWPWSGSSGTGFDSQSVVYGNPELLREISTWTSATASFAVADSFIDRFFLRHSAS